MNKEELIEALKEERNDYHPDYNYDIRLGFEGAIEMVEELLTTEAKPLVVPKELGEWLGCYDLGNEKYLFTIIGNLRDMWTRGDSEEFIGNNKKFIGNNKKKLIEVILGTRPYEIEKEKLYVVELISNNLMRCLGYDLVDKVFFISETQEERLNKFKKRFTEQEIKDYDERFWPFAVEVAE